VQRLRGQVASIDLEIQALRRESANTTRTIDEIQRKVERLPQREQEMVSLSRDYDNLKKSYDELLEKKLKANISKNLEENKKGERFQVMEPANLPTRPFSPNRLKILALALMVSVIIGVGGPIGFEIMDPRLRGSKDFKNIFEVPILACLPVIHDDRYRRRVATRKAVVIGGLVSILGAYVVFLAIYAGKVKLIVKSIASTIGG
jgi:succinoglycan biosynthesis transport protein ExoP